MALAGDQLRAEMTTDDLTELTILATRRWPTGCTPEQAVARWLAMAEKTAENIEAWLTTQAIKDSR